MNNFYNNQYNPQNFNYGQGQNFYQNQNMRNNNSYMPNGQGSNYNNYNPNNNMNNMNNNANNNYNQNDPNVFISGRIGRMLIASENVDTFSNSLKAVEWTRNPIYLQAKNIDVAPTFLNNNSSSNQNSNFSAPKCTIDEYMINANSAGDDYRVVLAEIESRKKNQNDEVERAQTEFMRSCLPNENNGMPVEDIYSKIGGNISGVLLNDKGLYGLVEKYLPFIKPGNNNSGDNKMYTNTPGSSAPPPGYRY